MEPSAADLRRPPKKARRTRIQDLSDDSLGMIFSFLDLTGVIRCSVVCSSWRKVIHRQYQQLQKNDPDDHGQISLPTRSFNEIAMLAHRVAFEDTPAKVFQWRGHSVGVNQCRMKMGHFLTGVGDKVMRLWSAESYKCLDEYVLPDKAPLIDFDFDESKVVGLVGTRICIWSRTETRSILSSRDALFPKGLCMRYVDPEAAIGCEDGKVRIFDLYSRKLTQIIKMHDAPVTCLSFSDDQLLFGGSSQGRSIALLDLSSGQQVSLLGSTYASVGIKTLCFNPGSNYLFAGSTAGHACCWDLRKQNRTLWEERVSPNVLYSMHHLRNDKSTLVIGGIDGVLRVVDQDSGEVIATHIMEESSSSRSASRPSDRNLTVRKAKKISSSDRIDLMSKACRPRITCLAVGMRKVVTTHNDNYIRVWKFK
ncbi:F-box/WD-40 repeat-containing protein At3g52030 [Ipomoea triloba]|uniref:F-box/WD-40 repeat-containing protein At3g52030 n=1 Tax=Ipomoea triloba TaxID=35885 RepID=UPI00125CEF28|nr:F-box/WD-40 repeat-containing protein At3g52030 [Ipomoea triloba]